MRDLIVLVLVLVLPCILASSCGDDDGVDAGAPEAGSASDTGASTSYADTVAWAAEWIAAYDRQAAATCPCLVAISAFASTQECMRALGSGPTWLECATAAVAASDAGRLITQAQARCLIDSTAARAACLEQAGCDPEAMSACLNMPDRPADCPALDTDLTTLVLEQCPDFGLLSRDQ